MLHSSYRPALGPAPQPGVDGYHHPQSAAHSYTHSIYAGSGASSSVSSNYDRFEYSSQTLIASSLESRLAVNALVRDCAVVGVPQSGGVTTTSAPGQRPLAGTTPIAFVALSAPGRERSMQGGDKESKRMKTELLKWIVDFAPAFKQMKGKLVFVESIPRGHNGEVLRHSLVEKATSPPAPGPDKGFFNTVLSESSAPSSPSKPRPDHTAETAVGKPKKAVRDSKRRATHSQIERRRREKINDRLVTLRSIVPACAKELEDRRRQKQEEQDEAARIAAGGAPRTYIDAATGKPKRKRNRKKPDTKKTAEGGDKEEELGLHKLEVLTHAINYIFELKAYIQKLETGNGPEHVPTADNPFGIKNRDGTYRQDAKVEDEPGCGLDARALGKQVQVEVASNTVRPKVEEDAEEEEEEDQIEDDPEEGDDEDEASEDEDDDEPLHRRYKKHMAYLPPPTTTATHSSSSSYSSTEPSPAFSTFSPATTITSPMMSLSAESPIMLPSPSSKASKLRVSQSPAFSALPASALPLPQSGRRESSSTSSLLLKNDSLASPSFGPFPAAAAVRARAGTLSFPTYGEESELRSAAPSRTPGLSDQPPPPDAGDANAAAELLLNFSTSPEVLRPVATRPHYRPIHSLPNVQHKQEKHPAQPQQEEEEQEQGEEEEDQVEGLASPPHLALDSSPHEDTADAMSDKTVEKPFPLALTMVKTEPRPASDAMDVTNA